MNSIFVGNLPFKITEEELKSFFERAGEVESVEIVRDRRTGDYRGFGFVNFVDENSIKKAIQDLAGLELKGRRLNIKKNEDRPAFPRRDEDYNERN